MWLSPEWCSVAGAAYSVVRYGRRISGAMGNTGSGIGAFGSYQPFVNDLAELVSEGRTGTAWEKRAAAALNGEAYATLRRVGSIDVLRQYGAFFTSNQLASKVIRNSNHSARTFHDPTCGAGDLLLAATSRLPTSRTLGGTLDIWQRALSGSDLHPEFVAATKLRLVLAAQLRFRNAAPIKDALEYFPSIEIRDGLAVSEKLAAADVALLNPPYVLADISREAPWAGGRMTVAALFLSEALKQVRLGSQVLAILPEVLRSGTNGEKWRRWIEQRSTVDKVDPIGLFDEQTDIDVFVLALTRVEKKDDTSSSAWRGRRRDSKTVGDHFHVRVGSVVPHRDPETGPLYPYLHARNIQPWCKQKDSSEFRRHSGAVVKGPLVAIRRTSRPGQQFRAVATVVSGKQEFALENHVIACVPRDGKVKSCNLLMKALKTDRSNNFLDVRIRCRHLTVSAIKEVPLSGEDFPDE